MTQMEVLESLEKGRISFNKAVALLKDPPVGPLKKGHFLKIQVTADGHRIFIPVPIGIVRVGFSLGRFVMKYLGKHQESEDVKKVCKVLDSIEARDIRALVRALQYCKTFPFIEVRDKDALVRITVV